MEVVVHAFHVLLERPKILEKVRPSKAPKLGWGWYPRGHRDQGGFQILWCIKHKACSVLLNLHLRYLWNRRSEVRCSRSEVYDRHFERERR